MYLNRASLLTDATIEQNIRWGDDEYSEDDVRSAAQLVQAHDFIDQLPAGYATFLGNGQRLSGAQAYLVALARAALRRPSLVLLDDDAKGLTESESDTLESAIAKLAAECTIITLSPRLPSLRNADDVLLLHEGRLEARGSHFSLLQSSALYRHVNYMRFNEFGTAVR